MFEVWLQMSDTNIDTENPSDLPALGLITSLNHVRGNLKEMVIILPLNHDF